MTKSNPTHKEPVVFPPLREPSTLTIRDLLEVRDRYHAALSNMPNVIATAIGRYRFRKGDSPELKERKTEEPRTLLNSKVDGDSWPAVLVFVRKWVDVGEPCSPWEVIPQYLYLEDGRLAPTCVIKITFDQNPHIMSDTDSISFPENHYGGGIGVYTKVQGEEHVGTVACLVTDGERHYALTARHVCGPVKQKVFTHRRGEPIRVGVSDPAQARMMRFSDLYPGYPGDHALTNVDAGLVRLDDMEAWTSQVLEIGELTEPANFAPHNLSLAIIEEPVRAFGAVSGDNMRAEIAGLFPRYRTIGGADYLADVMIAARKTGAGFRVQRGDSGALWVLDRKKADDRSIPIALNWGAMDLSDGDRDYQIAFATFVSSICKRLQIELVTGHNTGLHPVWGKQNHRNIAEIATDIAGAHKSPACKLISPHKAKMAELAFLPDLWKMQNKRSRKVEGPNHYAAIDLKHGGKVLGSRTSAKGWLAFYKAYNKNKKKAKKVNEGALPFRIGDVFDGLVAFRKAGDLKEFLGGAGILAHYVADACNPAHISRFGRGDPDEIDSSYHAIWDNWRKDSPAANAVVKQLKNATIRNNIKNSKAATKQAIALMKRTRKYVDVGDYVVPGEAALSRKQAREFCRSDKGEKAWIKCVADGCTVLLTLLESAWKVGGVNGPAVSDAAIKKVKINNSDIQHFLDEDEYLQSRNLKMIAGGN